VSNRTYAQKNFASYRIQAGKAKRLWMPDVDQIMENKHPWSEFSVLFEMEEWLSIKPKPDHEGTPNKTMIHRQLINARSLSLWHATRPEEVLRKM
jgi:hypothetical protein